ncbi:hypothetical protein DXU04_20990 [Bradyrhizobium diazoefficiens]
MKFAPYARVVNTHAANFDSLPGAEGNPRYSDGPKSCRSLDRLSWRINDHRHYPFIANSHPVTRSVLIQPEMSERVVECNGLRVFHRLAGVHQASRRFGRRR